MQKDGERRVGHQRTSARFRSDESLRVVRWAEAESKMGASEAGEGRGLGLQGGQSFQRGR